MLGSEKWFAHLIDIEPNPTMFPTSCLSYLFPTKEAAKEALDEAKGLAANGGIIPMMRALSSRELLANVAPQVPTTQVVFDDEPTDVCSDTHCPASRKENVRLAIEKAGSIVNAAKLLGTTKHILSREARSYGFGPPPKVSKQDIENALEKTCWDQTKAAKLLKISRNTIGVAINYYKLQCPPSCVSHSFDFLNENDKRTVFKNILASIRLDDTGGVSVVDENGYVCSFSSKEEAWKEFLLLVKKTRRVDK